MAPDALAPVISSILLLSCSHLRSLRCCASMHASLSYLAYGYTETGGQSENRLGVWPLWPEKRTPWNKPAPYHASSAFLQLLSTMSCWKLASKRQRLFLTSAICCAISLKKETGEKWLLTEEDGRGQHSAWILEGEKRGREWEWERDWWRLVRPSGEKPAKRRHHQTEMLKVHTLKDTALNRGTELLLGRHVWRRKASRQLQGSVGRLQGEALMDRRQQGQQEEPHVLMEKQLFKRQLVT